MTVPSVVFGPDARLEAGGGHVNRCINLARAVQPSCDVAFVLGPDAAPQWRARLSEEGFGIVGDGARCDAAVAVVDGYDLQLSDVAIWKRQSRALVMIEDLGRRFDGVDLYVSFAGPPPAKARVLYGPQYALLGARYARPVKPQSGGASSILVTCGLRDSASITALYLDALARCDVDGKAITVVLGKTAPHRNAVQRQADILGARIVVDVADMAALYDDADLVLGAGGVSLFERMARGRASITVVAAANQAYAATRMAAAGGTMLAGDARGVSATAMATSVATLLADRNARAKMGMLGRQTVDGLGAERTAREILTLAAGVTENAPAALSN